jgi:hypothetical protein
MVEIKKTIRKIERSSPESNIKIYLKNQRILSKHYIYITEFVLATTPGICRLDVDS